VRVHVCVHLVRHAVPRDLGQGFRPRKRGTLTLGIELGLVPSRDEVEALLGCAHRAGVLGVHVQAEGVAINLRRANLDQFQQLRLQAAIVQYTQAEEDEQDALLGSG